jgi:hypothetical protein
MWQISIKACVAILGSIEKVMYLEPFDPLMKSNIVSV